MEIVSCLAMGANAYYYLAPIGRHPDVSRLWIVRPEKVKRGAIPGAEYVLVPTRFKPWRFLQMTWICLRLGRRKEVKAFASINPVPYGFIALIAATFCRKPVHFGFVGTDWYLHARGRWGGWLRPIFRRADFVTATGATMRQEMIAYGLDADRVAILPHGIDLENYGLNDPGLADYSCLYVGQLIERKRVDLILQAFASVREVHPDARLCIVGDGPLMNELKQMAASLGIASAVDFAGHQARVQPYLARSKIILIASYREGMPFSIIEGMCSGLVPVSTPVGTVTDWITDGENGLLVPQDEPQVLASAVDRLLSDPDLYQRLRRNALGMRERLSFEAATAVWDSWFARL